MSNERTEPSKEQTTLSNELNQLVLEGKEHTKEYETTEAKFYKIVFEKRLTK